MARHRDIPDDAHLLRFDKRCEGAAHPLDLPDLGKRPDVVDLPEVEGLDAHPLEGRLEVHLGIRVKPARRFAGLEDPFPEVRAAPPDLAVVVLAPRVGLCRVEVGDPLVEGLHDDGRCLRMSPVCPEDPLAAEPNEGDLPPGLSEPARLQSRHGPLLSAPGYKNVQPGNGSSVEVPPGAHAKNERGAGSFTPPPGSPPPATRSRGGRSSSR
ncbi:hypothetical protein DSECCO2_369770 [anaerobic digester metagenome]